MIIIIIYNFNLMYVLIIIISTIINIYWLTSISTLEKILISSEGNFDHGRGTHSTMYYIHCITYTLYYCTYS